MKIRTTRFGEIEVDGDRLIHFEKGILGFPDVQDYILLQTDEEGNFFWLQAVGREDLAFVVSDPLLFLSDYEVPLKQEDFEHIELTNMQEAQVLIIVNKVDRVLTGNLQGPLVINSVNRRARQLVLSEKKYSTRHPRVDLDRSQPKQAVSKTA